MIKVFGYIRLSEKEKNNTSGEIETSLVNQSKDIKNYCKNNNKQLIHIFDGDKYITGSDWYRKDFNDMIFRAISGEVSEIIVTDKNRLFRDADLFKKTVMDLKNNNVMIFDLTKNNYLSEEDYADRLTAFVDEMKIIEGRKKQRQLLDRKIKEKLPITPPPFGYKYNKLKHNKDWIIDIKKAEIIKSIFNDFNNGNDIFKISYNYNIPLRKVYRILKNKNLTGGKNYSFYKKIKNSQGKIVNKEKFSYECSYPYIISESLFNEVQNNFR